MISDIKFHIRCLDPSSQSLLQNPSICLLLNGLKKESPAVPDKRLLVSLSQVHTMVDKLRSGLFTPHTNLLLEAAFLTAYYGFLRGGEFTINTKIFDPSHDLTIKDITFHTDYFSIYLKHSKTDRDNNGSTINISRTNDGYCPLTYQPFIPHSSKRLAKAIFQEKFVLPLVSDDNVIGDVRRGSAFTRMYVISDSFHVFEFVERHSNNPNVLIASIPEDTPGLSSEEEPVPAPAK
ncbi:hypothetical protein DPX16_23609 [Anabarilius grahami]|uniref:Uncharacterized protein n=1 Tax=Anabarilius grahami TaxID=495550 RepID=A0A3N0ZB85_ANAGA|nr:hypothetical protein DPX16_23609 [Anabarilius grahami]